MACLSSLQVDAHNQLYNSKRLDERMKATTVSMATYKSSYSTKNEVLDIKVWGNFGPPPLKLTFKVHPSNSETLSCASCFPPYSLPFLELPSRNSTYQRTCQRATSFHIPESQVIATSGHLYRLLLRSWRRERTSFGPATNPTGSLDPRFDWTTESRRCKSRLVE